MYVMDTVGFSSCICPGVPPNRTESRSPLQSLPAAAALSSVQAGPATAPCCLQQCRRPARPVANSVSRPIVPAGRGHWTASYGARACRRRTQAEWTALLASRLGAALMGEGIGDDMGLPDVILRLELVRT